MRATADEATGNLSVEHLVRVTLLDVCVITTIPAMVVVLVLVIALKLPKAPSNPDPFCCPMEARAMNHAVNRTLDPCDNFYVYVCLNTIKFRLWPFWDVTTSFKTSIATGTNLQNNSAAVFMSSVFKRCVETIWRKDRLAAELADGIADVGNLKSEMTNMEVLQYLLQTNLKFQIHSVVSIDLSEEKQTRLRVHFGLVDETVYHNIYRIAVTAGTKVFNTKFRTNVSLHEVYHFQRNLEIMIKKRQENSIPEEGRKQSAWMTLEFWKDNIIRTGWVSLTAIREIQIQDAIAIETFMSAIERTEYHKIGLILLLAHSTLYAFINVATSSPGHLPNKSSFDLCFATVEMFHNLQDHMYTKMLTSAEKERHLHDLYASVVRAMELNIKSRSSLEEEDIAHLLGRLREVSFMAPSQRLLNVTVPKATQNFGRDFLQGRLYEFHADELRKHDPDIGYIDLYTPLSLNGDKYIVISPVFFKLLNFNKTHKAFLNMPTIGVEMAALLWNFLLRNTVHPKKMDIKIDAFYECFWHRYYSGYMRYEAIDGVSKALALGTVISALNRTQWHTLKSAWSHWKMSLSQLFYIRETFYRCPYSIDKFSEVSLNVPLSYNRDFVLSFRCRDNSRMSRVEECIL